MNSYKIALTLLIASALVVGNVNGANYWDKILQSKSEVKEITSHYSGTDYLMYNAGDTGFNFRDPDKFDGSSKTGTVKLETDQKIQKISFNIGYFVDAGDQVKVYRDSNLNNQLGSYSESSGGAGIKNITLTSSKKDLYFQITNADNTNGLPIRDLKLKFDTGIAPEIGDLSPQAKNLNPINGVEIEANITDLDSDQLNLTFYNASDDTKIGKIENENNGTYSVEWNSLSEDQTYNWYAEVTDGTSTVTSSTVSFTTIGVTLDWNDQSSNEDGFKIYNNASGTLTKIAETAANTETYTDYSPNLEFDKNFTYQVKSYNNYGESSPTTGFIEP